MLQTIDAPNFQMEILYGSGCYRIDQTLCPQSIQDYPYYDLINKGVEYTFMISLKYLQLYLPTLIIFIDQWYQYITLASSLQRQYAGDGYLNYSDPLYTKFRSIAGMASTQDNKKRITLTFFLFFFIIIIKKI